MRLDPGHVKRKHKDKESGDKAVAHMISLATSGGQDESGAQPSTEPRFEAGAYHERAARSIIPYPRIRARPRAGSLKGPDPDAAMGTALHVPAFHQIVIAGAAWQSCCGIGAPSGDEIATSLCSSR